MALRDESERISSEAADGVSRSTGTPRVSTAAGTIRTGSTMSSEKAVAAEIRRLESKCIFEIGSSMIDALTVHPMEIRMTLAKGRGVYASALIPAGTLIAEFDGPTYEVDTTTQLPPHCVDYAIQFDEHAWRDSEGVARLVNHSCDPNCGIKNLFQIVAMRDIQPGEEITWDYDMSENSDWIMRCKCGSELCRGVIRGYRFLPESFRRRYQGFISEWLLSS